MPDEIEQLAEAVIDGIDFAIATRRMAADSS